MAILDLSSPGMEGINISDSENVLNAQKINKRHIGRILKRNIIFQILPIFEINFHIDDFPTTLELFFQGYAYIYFMYIIP